MKCKVELGFIIIKTIAEKFPCCNMLMVKVKLYLCPLCKRVGVEVWIYSFLTSALGVYEGNSKINL